MHQVPARLPEPGRGCYYINLTIQKIDCDDLPRNGAYVIGAMANHNLSLGGDGADASSAAAGLAEQLGVSKQAVSQLLDTLVARGYLHRDPDPADRRRLAITLTERGQAAAHLAAGANRTMDHELEAHLGSDGVRTLRRQLAAVMHTGRLLREAAGSTATGD